MVFQEAGSLGTPHAPDTAARVQTEAPSLSIQQFCWELPALIKTEVACYSSPAATGGTGELRLREGRSISLRGGAELLSARAALTPDE